MEYMEKTGQALVYQSNKLIEASYRLRIGQQKFLRLMASKIRKDDEDFKMYEFKIADVMELFGIKNQATYTELTPQLQELMGNVLKFKVGKTTTLVQFLVIAQQDEGSGIIKVQFHPILKPLYLNLNKENPFTAYELSNALKLRSIYSLRFYELLKQYQKVGNRTLAIDKIREMFELEPNEYTRYNDFKRKVVLQAQKEINEKTDILFDYEEIKTGRKVTALRFNIKPKIKNQDEISATVLGDALALDQDLADKLQKVKDIMYDHDIDTLTAKKIYDAAQGDLKIIKKVYDDKKNKSAIDLIAVMISLVKPGVYIEPIKNNRKTHFNDYDQRTYDVKELEKKLLGRDDDMIE